MSTYREDLDALVMSNGFKWLTQRAKAQWGPTAFNARVASLIAQAEGSPTFDLKGELRILTQVQNEVNGLLSWPQAELDKIAKDTQKAAEPPSMMRSGR